jgi:hypothetical protein
VQEHAGRIALRSQRGQGASFFVELPVAAGSRTAAGGSTRTAPAKAATTAAGTAASGTRVAGAAREVFEGSRVLVVEDEPALSAAVEEALTDAVFEVDRAGDGVEGLA